MYPIDYLRALDRCDPTLIAAMTNCVHLFDGGLAVEHEQRLDVILT
jgi:hypothetical protein